MKYSAIIALAASAAMLTACAQPGGPGVMQGGQGLNKQEVGTVAGAIGGAVLGSTIGSGAGKTAATIGGGLIGGYIGNQIGQSLDSADRAQMYQTTSRAMETAQPGQALPWRGQHASGTVTPSNYYQTADGQYCREYNQTINVGGKTEKGYGTACRQSDGTWQIVK